MTCLYIGKLFQNFHDPAPVEFDMNRRDFLLSLSLHLGREKAQKCLRKKQEENCVKGAKKEIFTSSIEYCERGKVYDAFKMWTFHINSYEKLSQPL